MTIITPLPTPPSRDDPTTFNSRADAFLGALPTFASEMNEAAESMTAGSIGVYSALRNDIPLYGDAVVAIKVSTDRWVIRTPVANGGPHDYAEYEMYNWGAYQGIAYAWGMHSLRAEIGGQLNRFLEQHPSAAKVSTFEFAYYVGRMADPFNSTYYDFVGFGHGNMGYNSIAITMDSDPTNYRDNAPVGTILRGAQFSFGASYNMKLKDGTVIGTMGVAHIFDANGLRVSVQNIISASGIGCQNSYSASMPTTGVNRIKAAAQAAATVGVHDGGQKGNWTAASVVAAWHTDRPSNLLELSLPTGHPGSPPGDWSEATTSQIFVMDNAAPSNISKLYLNWRSGAAAVAYSGTYNHLAKYQVRIGSPA